MRIVIACLGTHGDVRPYVAFGSWLKKMGHEVCIVTDPREKEFCEYWGLDFHPLHLDLSILCGPPVLQWRLIKHVVRELRRSLEEQFECLTPLLTECDLFLHNPLIVAAPHLAEHLDLPVVRVILQPEFRTKEHPSALFSLLGRLGGRRGNLLSHLLVEQLGWQPTRKIVNKWRMSRGLQRVGLLGPTHDRRLKHKLILVAVSQHCIKRPRDWGGEIVTPGFFRLHEAAHWTPPEALSAFLREGEPPIYVGFGSISTNVAKTSLEKIIAAIKTLKVRAVLSGEFQGIENLSLPPSIFFQPNAPHDWLFPRVAAVVHHGGAGTFAAGLYAGKPTLITPFLYDQFQWGDRAYKLGVGPKAIPFRKLNQRSFETSLRDLLENSAYRERAEELGRKLAEESSFFAAVGAIKFHNLHKEGRK